MNGIQSENKKGIVYIGHLPYGFFENEVNKYFDQFGKVTKVKLSRSKKTGRTKGYGFIEFDDENVAKIAAETMNNYLMFDKILKCEFRPNNEMHPKLFKGASKLFKPFKTPFKSKNQYNASKPLKTLERSFKKSFKTHNKKMEILKKIGINYDFEMIVPKLKTKLSKKTIATREKSSKVLKTKQKKIRKINQKSLNFN